MSRPRLVTPGVALILSMAGCGSSTEPRVSRAPGDVKFITSDIDRFWTAFDKIAGIGDTVPLRVDYLNAGTPGLRDFANLRWKTATALTRAVWTRRQYYSSIRSSVGGVGALDPEFRKVYTELDGLIEEPVFPDVYFVIGAMSTGGTTSDNGLLIGTELFAVTSESPLTELTPWERSVIRSLSVLPAIVAHELVHYQQRSRGSGLTLLGQSIREGSADFVGKLLSGQTINDAIRGYGDAHEAALWAEFKTEMHGADVSRWLYNGGSVTSTSERPADLGYYIGARIAESYYAKAADKRQAVADILAVTDYTDFLQRSGYSP